MANKRLNYAHSNVNLFHSVKRKMFRIWDASNTKSKYIFFFENRIIELFFHLMKMICQQEKKTRTNFNEPIQMESSMLKFVCSPKKKHTHKINKLQFKSKTYAYSINPKKKKYESKFTFISLTLWTIQSIVTTDPEKKNEMRIMRKCINSNNKQKKFCFCVGATTKRWAKQFFSIFFYKTLNG